MSLRTHAKHQLSISRQLIDSLLPSFDSPDAHFYVPVEGANPAIWILGHLGLADNSFAKRFRPDTEQKPDGWDELFWFGTSMQADRTVYPGWDNVVAYFRERRENFLKVIDDVSDEELAAAAPAASERGPIAGAPSIAQVLVFASYHEGVHTGQLTVCHRGLGNAPVFQP